MDLSDQLIIVANDVDHTSVNTLKEKIEKNYPIEVKLWTSDEYDEKENRVDNNQVYIIIGKFTNNPAKNDYRNNVDIIKDNGKFFIGYGFRKAVVFDYQQTESSRTAVNYFMRFCLKQFINKYLPDIKMRKILEKGKDWPTKDDLLKIIGDTNISQLQQASTKPAPDEPETEDEKPKPVKEPPNDYPEVQKYHKEFYKIGPNAWKIKYYDEEGVFDEYNGLLFMHHIFSNPGKNIKLDELYYLINPPVKENILGDEDNEKDAEIEEQDEIDIDDSRDKVKKQYKKPDPLTLAGLENQRTKDKIAKEISDYKKGIKTLDKINKKLLEILNDQKNYLKQLYVELEDLKKKEKETRTTRPGERKKTIAEKLAAQDNVTEKTKEIKDTEDKIKFNTAKINSNKNDITNIKKKIYQLAVELNLPTVETSIEFDNVRTSIINNIKYFRMKLKLAGFNEFIKYWDNYVKKYNGYTYNPVELEPWKLVK